jgi:hypothetical protein
MIKFRTSDTDPGRGWTRHRSLTKCRSRNRRRKATGEDGGLDMGARTRVEQVVGILVVRRGVQGTGRRVNMGVLMARTQLRPHSAMRRHDDSFRKKKKRNDCEKERIMGWEREKSKKNKNG